jgi:hypothetical protein
MFKTAKSLGLFVLETALDHIFPKAEAEPQLLSSEERPQEKNVTTITEVPLVDMSIEQIVTELSGQMGEETQYEIPKDNVLVYGMLPNRLILAKANGYNVVSYFLDADPAFSAMTFAILRDKLQHLAVVNDSFLYDNEGAVCYVGAPEFPISYVAYLKSTLKRAKGISSGSSRRSEELH